MANRDIENILKGWEAEVAEAERARDDIRAELEHRQIIYEARKDALESLRASIASLGSTADTRKKVAVKKSASKKSVRASSLEQQIKGAARGDNDKRGHLGDGPVCTICSHTEDYEDHSQPSPHYHPFQPPAHPVPKVLRQPYSEQEAYGANLETGTDDASNAVRAGG